MPLSQTTCLDNGTLNEEAVDCLVSAVPSTPPPTPVVVDITEEVFRMPLYLEHAREGSPQLNMLVELVLAMSADGKFVQATATCDEISSPFPRIGSTRHVSLLSDATIYVPSDIMLSPVHVIVRKIRGLALDQRIAIQLNFIEWIPGNRSTLEVMADIKLLSEGLLAATRCLYVGDAYKV